MGSTYHNTIVKGPAQEQIVAALMEQQHDALVSPTRDDLMLVYTGLAQMIVALPQVP